MPEDTPAEPDDTRLDAAAPGTSESPAHPGTAGRVSGGDAAPGDLEDTEVAEVSAVPSAGSAPGEAAAQPPNAKVSSGTSRYQRPAPFETGQEVTGRVVKIDPNEVVVDLGLWVEGVVATRELSVEGDRPNDEVVAIGEEVAAVVTVPEDVSGRVRLSVARGLREAAWAAVDAALAAEGVLRGTVREAVKGGLRLDVGVTGFLPASQIELRPVGDLTPYVGRELECRIIETDRRRHQVVLSRRALLEAEREGRMHAALAELEAGQVLDGVVAGITPLGLFVDLGGVDGLVHNTEVAWTKVPNLRSEFRVGDEIKVKVLAVERERGRVSLSRRAVLEDPWALFSREHQAGDVVEGKVTQTTDFGAFVEVGGGVEGLVHISELAPYRVEKAADVVRSGDEVRVRVLQIDLGRRRLSLSIRAVDEDAGGGRERGGGGGRDDGGGGREGARRAKRGKRAPERYSVGHEEDASSVISGDGLAALAELGEQLRSREEPEGAPESTPEPADE